MTDNDLPLLSNISDIRARHYLIFLEPSFDQKIFYGKVIIFFEATSPCEKKGKCCTRECICKSHNTTQNENQSDDALFEKQDHIPITSDGLPKSKSEEIQLKSDFELILDCCDIKVKQVKEVLSSQNEIFGYLDPNYTRKCYHDVNIWTTKQQLPLEFSVSQWCVRIRKPGIKCVDNFPKVVCIEYETLPKGKSVLWQNDQDGNPCVFTPAAPINNRSLLPCQDPPSAMGTWQAWITVFEGYNVSMTGDKLDEKYASKKNEIKVCKNDVISQGPLNYRTLSNESSNSENTMKCQSQICFYYYTTMVLPIATIAIAIGKWEVKILPVLNPPLRNGETADSRLNVIADEPCPHYKYPCHMTKEWNSNTQITVVSSSSLCNSIEPICDFLPFVVKAAVQLLGVYPCRRIEVVVLPRTFSSLGLASPNLIFLSPTVSINDIAAFIRLAHEVR